jgi:transposase InsO family protein
MFAVAATTPGCAARSNRPVCERRPIGSGRTKSRRCRALRSSRSTHGYMDEELVERALQIATSHRRPPEGVLHHSDRGSRYASNN